MLLMLSLLSGTPHAAERGVVAGLYGGALRTDPQELLGSTWAAVPRVGYRFLPPLTAELDLGLSQGLTRLDRSYYALTPAATLLYSPFHSWPVQPFIAAGPGLIYKHINRDFDAEEAGQYGLGGYKNPDLDLLISAGPGVAVPVARRFSLRADLRLLADIGGESIDEASGDAYTHWEWTLGVMFHPGPEREVEADALVDEEAEEEPAEAPEEPIAEAPADSLTVTPEVAMIWLPHPICRWVPAEEASGGLEDADRVRVTAPGYLPTQLQVEGPTEVALDPAPSQGSLVLVSHRGDRVVVGEQTTAVSGDGLAVLNAPEGDLSVRIEGGGRAVSHDLLIASGYATWVRVPDPEDHLFLFPLGVAALDPGDLQAVQDLADAPGDYRFLIRGSYSPEGDPQANMALARARASAAGQALVAAGLPEERVVYQDPYIPSGEEEDLERLRHVRIHPEPAGGPK
jgi:hypothetical protein